MIKKIAFIFFVSITLASTAGTSSFFKLHFFSETNYSHQCDTLPATQLVLTGVIKTEAGQLLSNVKVVAGNEHKASTDSAGNFSLALSEDKPTIISFIHDKMITVKRSYHPAMQEKTFNVTMIKDTCKYCGILKQVLNKKN